MIHLTAAVASVLFAILDKIICGFLGFRFAARNNPLKIRAIACFGRSLLVVVGHIERLLAAIPDGADVRFDPGFVDDEGLVLGNSGAKAIEPLLHWIRNGAGRAVLQ